MKLKRDYTSVLHHTNFGGCEKLALGFMRYVSSALIVFHDESEIIDTNLFGISKSTKFAGRISIRKPSTIIKSRFLFRQRYKADETFILWHGRYSLLASILSLNRKESRFLIHIGTNVEKVRILEKLSMLILFAFFRNRVFFVCVSSFVESTFLQSFAFFKNNTVVIPNGISAEKLDSGNSNSDHEFAMVSRFDNSKFQDLIIRTLVSRGKGEKALFIGDGEDLEKCRLIAQSSSHPEQFTFFGNSQQPFSHLSKNQIFIFAADEREGFGLALYEAILSGLRVIASDIPAAREIIRDDRFLFLNKIEDLSRAIDYANSNEKEHLRYMNQLRLDILKNFSLTVMHKKYIEIGDR